MMKTVYLDYAASTPVDDQVMTAMQPYFSEVFGNPSSLHHFGRRSETALEEARREIAKGLNAHPSEIIFTSCGSESDNLALRGAAFAARKQTGKNHLAISPVEHPAVLMTAIQLKELHGFDLTWIPVTKTGLIEPGAVMESIQEDTILVSVMSANNEIGTINPIAKIGSICQERGIPFHSDAVQSGAHFPLDVEELHVDLLSLGAHKFYGPKGVGVLYIRSGTQMISPLTGGSQEFGMRPATQNVPLIVGMAKAFRLVLEKHQERIKTILPLRDSVIKHILSEIPDCQLTGDPVERLPNHASFVFDQVDGNLLIQVLDSAGFACSSGSACKTGDPEPSKVLTMLGYSPTWALGSLRVTSGHSTTRDEIERFLEILPDCVHQVRELKQ